VGSCAELEARRSIQKGDKLYEDGKYSEAIAKYEKALEQSDLAIGHHNLAVAAFIAFQPGIDTPANQLYAQKASEHFQAYLKQKPNDTEIIELMTTVWLNSDQTDVALAYWEAERVANPGSVAPIRKLGTIQRLAGNYEEALKWDYARVELAKEPKDKVLALVQIGQLQYSRLAKSTMIDDERVEVADSGIDALQQALAIQPNNAKLHSLIATIYQFRALAHQTGWAQLADIASQRYHHIKRKSLADAAKAKQAKEGPDKKKPTDAVNPDVVNEVIRKTE
jgi:tetratricopeptide (TPR) repeat protein